jgi:hypothetical protein
MMESLVWLYRLESGELSAVSVERSIVPEMRTHDWAAVASRYNDGDGPGINVEVIHGDPDRKLNGVKLIDLVRGDLQE